MSINIKDEFMNMFTEEELKEIQDYTRECVIVNNKYKSAYKIEQSSDSINIKK